MVVRLVQQSTSPRHAICIVARWIVTMGNGPSGQHVPSPVTQARILVAAQQHLRRLAARHAHTIGKLQHAIISIARLIVCIALNLGECGQFVMNHVVEVPNTVADTLWRTQMQNTVERYVRLQNILRIATLILAHLTAKWVHGAAGALAQYRARSRMLQGR